jgi:hypothetical protein
MLQGSRVTGQFDLGQNVRSRWGRHSAVPVHLDVVVTPVQRQGHPTPIGRGCRSQQFGPHQSHHRFIVASVIVEAPVLSDDQACATTVAEI